ncbi:cytochrome c [Ramlibacter sp. AW1]|uniref:Cytochrome c n=1 Tax=Ramlibacter aurantiacus TaxID=2801330 RepID=A0A937D3C5_9BURK|nr:cytochrome c [Ramlibacter aurantiacus]MBL0422524.1 cytochrome c [Ramlibacter aurantiacus]
MDKNRKKLALGLAVGCIATLVLLGLIGLTVVYTGAYNVAATEQHMSITRWAFDTTMHRSVRRRAEEVPRAESVTPAMLASGASQYKASCQHCHGGPGAKREKWADGMRPQPPHLAEAASDWKPGEILWIVKHGIKMTGMPAFGPTHDDETLRSIVAFVAELPAMTPERYAALGSDSGSGAGGQKGGANHHGSGGQLGSSGGQKGDSTGPAASGDHHGPGASQQPPSETPKQ